MKNTAASLLARTEAGPGGCMIWTGGLSNNGYGKVRIRNGPAIGAHRAVWILTKGPIPARLFVCHICDVKRCINPDHLFLGTNGDNISDAIAKGIYHPPVPTSAWNFVRGKRHGMAKLTEDNVREILLSGGPHRVIAARFGVSRSVIGQIKARQIWRHVEI